MKGMIAFAAGVAVTGAAALASPAVQSFAGGLPFGSFFTSTGDAIGYRFDVSSDIIVNNVGLWNGTLGGADGAVDSSHEWGIWDSAQNLLASGVIDPADGFQDGDFFYSNVDSNLSLAPGEVYTIAVVYSSTDLDSYLSSITAITTASEVNLINAVAPAAADLGLTFPADDSVGNPGRLGPNFTFIPSPGAAGVLGLAGLVAARRRR